MHLVAVFNSFEGHQGLRSLKSLDLQKDSWCGMRKWSRANVVEYISIFFSSHRRNFSWDSIIRKLDFSWKSVIVGSWGCVKLVIMASSRRANNWLMFSNGLCVSVAILTHLCCFLTYLFPLTLYSVTLYPLWKEERKNKWLDKHMTIILTCLTRSSASCQRWTHQILQIPVSLQNLFLGIYSLALLYSKTNHLIPHQRCWQ